MVNARPVYVCPVCNLASNDGWMLRWEDAQRSAWDCECGAHHTIHADGGCGTVTPKRRRSAERDYCAQVASVRCPIEGGE